MGYKRWSFCSLQPYSIQVVVNQKVHSFFILPFYQIENKSEIFFSLKQFLPILIIMIALFILLNSSSYLNSRHLINDIMINLMKHYCFTNQSLFFDLIDDTLLHFVCFVRVFPCSSRLGQAKLGSRSAPQVQKQSPAGQSFFSNKSIQLIHTVYVQGVEQRKIIKLSNLAN